MAFEKNIVPERNADLFLGDESKSAKLATKAVSGEVWVTPELQQAAQNFDKSWGSSHHEALIDQKIQFVELKFKDAATKKKFFAALKPFADCYKLHFSSGVVLPDEGEAKGVIQAVRLEFFRPDIFSEIVQDVAKTDLDSVAIKPTDHELAKLYSAAFTIPFVRMDLQVGEEVDAGDIESLRKTLAASQKSLVLFLELLLKAWPLESGHRVVVHAVNKIEVNGELREIKGAAKRALLALVLLRDKPVFSTKEFVQHYNGETNPAEPRHDFDNAMKALRGVIDIVVNDFGGQRRFVRTFNKFFHVKSALCIAVKSWSGCDLAAELENIGEVDLQSLVDDPVQLKLEPITTKSGKPFDKIVDIMPAGAVHVQPTQATNN